MDPALRNEILSILAGANDLTLATVCPDGYPRATTVSYAHEGLAVYFGCSEHSQKAQNIARNPKVSFTVNLPYAIWSEIRGISAAGRAHCLTNPQELESAGHLLLQKFPEGVAEYAPSGLEGIALFRIVPEVISLLDYRKGFGHTDLVTDLGNVEGRPYLL